MAKKFTYHDVPAYQEGPFAIVKRDDIDGLWHVYHAVSGLIAMGNYSPFKQKRDALTLAQDMAKTEFDWEFTTREEMRKLNSDEAMISQLLPIFSKGA